MILTIAWRNIWRNKARSVILITAMSLGIIAGLFLMAFSWGMYDKRIDDAIAEEYSHLQIHHKEFREDFQAKYTIVNPNEYEKLIKGQENVDAYSIRSVVMGSASSAHGSAMVKLHGIDTTMEQATTKLRDKLIEGKYLGKSRSVPVLVGEKLAEKLKLKIRSKLPVNFTDVNGEITSLALKVVGIYKSKNGQLDQVNIFVPKDRLDRALQVVGAHEIGVLVKDETKLEDFKSTIVNLEEQNIVESWRELDPMFSYMLDNFDTQMNVVIWIILIAVSFGIVNTMLMAIVERIREIGMMMAIGFNKLKLFLMIMLETLFLAVIATPIGLIVSYFLVMYFNSVGIPLDGMGDAMEQYGFSSIVYPVLQSYQYGRIASMVFTVTMISAIFPAIRALRLNPTKAIRKL